MILALAVIVEGGVITVDLGSGQGLHQGSKLGLYKVNFPNVKVGELEVTDVMDTGNCHAKISTISSSVQAEASDIVRPE